MIRSYEQSLNTHIFPVIGSMRVGDVQRGHVQRLVDGMARADRHATSCPIRDGGACRCTPGPLDGSTIRNALMPLRVMFRRAIVDEVVTSSPLVALDLPSAEGRRDTVVEPLVIVRLLDALERVDDRALWAVAFYTGLRLGEIAGLRWQDVNLQERVLHVRQAWDERAGVAVAPKSSSGVRTVPIMQPLRGPLAEHRLAAGWNDGLVFGVAPDRSFTTSCVRERARLHWRKAGLSPVTPHVARHTHATLMIAAGANQKTLSTLMGHGSIAITLDRYGHLFQDALVQAGALGDAYLAKEHAKA